MPCDCSSGKEFFSEFIKLVLWVKILFFHPVAALASNPQSRQTSFLQAEKVRRSGKCFHVQNLICVRFCLPFLDYF